MRRKSIVIVALLWVVGTTLVARTPQEAAAIASGFMSQKGGSATVAQRMQRAKHAAGHPAVALAYTQHTHADDAAVYVFTSENGGFVLVSANDDSRTVLGYADKGTFDAENIPSNMHFWLQMYADEIAKIKNKPLRRAGVDILPKAKKESPTYPVVAPILGDVEWGQDEPYNNLCPMLNNERCVTGCVATAISQIMYVHKYPTQGTGSYSYTQENGVSASANFGATTYEWANMLPYYNKGAYTEEQANAVATLMYHVGVASNMEYDPEGSGALSSVALANMSKYFGYDAGITPNPKDYMDEEVVLQNIVADLQAQMPVYISGVTEQMEGHAFVCDGIQADGYLHINWGWYGMSNGYFALSALDPDQQGTGGSSGALAFTEEVCVYTNIQPDQGGEAQPLVTVERLYCTSQDTIDRNMVVSFSLEEFASSGMKTAAGELGYYIYDQNDTLVTSIGIRSFELEPGYYYPEPINLLKALPADLVNGEYVLEICYEDALGNIQPVLVKHLGRIRVPITVTSEYVIIGEVPSPALPEQAQRFNQLDASVYAGTQKWQLDLATPFFWADYESENEVLIRMNVNSGSSTSIVGSYVMDKNDSGKAGTIDSDVLYAMGYYMGYYPSTPEDLHLTISKKEGNELLVEYYIAVNDTTYTDTVSIADPMWLEYDVENDEYYYYDEAVSYELANMLPASVALATTQALKSEDATLMAYYVGGKICQMRNTPEEILDYQSARFDISDDGNRENALYCYNTKWIDNKNYVTGKELAVGDSVVIYGQLQHYKGTTPEIKGSVYYTDRAMVGVGHVATGADQVVQKQWHNGELLIKRGEHLYNIMGIKLE